MKFKISNNITDQLNDMCQVIGISKSGNIINKSNQINQINQISERYVQDILNISLLNNDLGNTLMLNQVPNVPFKSILFVNCGEKSFITIREYKKIINNIILTLNNYGIKKVFYFLIDLNINKCNIYWKLRKTIEIIKDTMYFFNKFKQEKNKLKNFLKEITFYLEKNSYCPKSSKKAIQDGLAISYGIKVAKDLGNMPPNICNASYLFKKSEELEIKYKENIKVSSINEKEMKNIGMNAYLAVGKGSKNESLMSIIEYKGENDKNPPIILIGKGLTFDSGGISIKSSEKMDEMKYDMCGAAVVYGVLLVAAKLKIKLNIVGILAGCENMIDSNSMRPGDIITTLSGKTVEILNTDAEGRLVLCDVLTYVEKFNPKIVIDIATLTGACVIALGKHFSGLISNDDILSKKLILSSKQTDDYIWRLPLTDEFSDQLKSNFADIANVGGREGGAITAGCFLSHFVSSYNWAHIDIAGTAWSSGENKGATGRTVSLLSQFLINMSNS